MQGIGCQSQLEQEEQKLQHGQGLQFLSESNAKILKISSPKNNHSMKKKQKSSRLISRHVRSKQRRNGKKKTTVKLQFATASKYHVSHIKNKHHKNVFLPHEGKKLTSQSLGYKPRLIQNYTWQIKQQICKQQRLHDHRGEH